MSLRHFVLSAFRGILQSASEATVLKWIAPSGATSAVGSPSGTARVRDFASLPSAGSSVPRAGTNRCAARWSRAEAQRTAGDAGFRHVQIADLSKIAHCPGRDRPARGGAAAELDPPKHFAVDVDAVILGLRPCALHRCAVGPTSGGLHREDRAFREFFGATGLTAKPSGTVRPLTSFSTNDLSVPSDCTSRLAHVAGAVGQRNPFRHCPARQRWK